MPKLISFLLLFLFLWQIGGYLLEFEIESSRVRKELKKLSKEAVPLNQLVYFQFSAKEIQSLTWTKKNEFKKDGHFYDVVWRHHLKGGLIELQCVSDDQETELFKKLDQYVSVNLANPNSERPLKKWSKLVFGVYLLTNLTIEPIIQTPLFISAKLRYSYFDLLSQSHLFIETPPPNGEFA
jgi:hypothetical protein